MYRAITRTSSRQGHRIGVVAEREQTAQAIAVAEQVDGINRFKPGTAPQRSGSMIGGHNTIVNPD